MKSEGRNNLMRPKEHGSMGYLPGVEVTSAIHLFL